MDRQARLASLVTEMEKQVHLDETGRQLAVETVVRCVRG
jgi:hypothetical protein